ncbi:MAG: tetratricopeptide repeat protein [Paludibacteraceae bacterium]
MKKKDQTYSEDHLDSTIRRYENSLLIGKDEYFDVDDIEALIDHYMEEDKQDTAMDIARLGLSIHPGNTDVKVMQARLFLDCGKVEEAEMLSELLKSVEPNNPDVILLEGEVFLSKGMSDEAKKLFLKAISEDESYNYNVAYAYFANANYNEAIPYFEKEIKKDPTGDMDMVADTAFCYQQTEQTEKAIALYEKELDIDPYMKDAWFNLGQLYFAQENFDKSAESFDYAHIVGDDEQALLQKGNAFFQGNKLQCAIDAYKEYAATGDEAKKIALVFIGECYEKMSDIEKAKEYYEEAIADDETNIGALSGLCICCLEQNEYEKSIKYADLAIALDPSIAENWMYKAEGALNLNLLDIALSCYKKANELAPSFAEPLFAIGNIYIDIGNYEKALDYYNKGSMIDKTVDKISLYYAITYFKKGNHVLAHDYLIAAILKDSETKDIFFDICPEAKEIDLFKNL